MTNFCDILIPKRRTKKQISPILSEPTFETEPKMVEKYDFKLPKLTQKLNDNKRAKYAQLLFNEDKIFLKTFKELAEWLSSLLKPPKVDQQETRRDSQMCKLRPK